MILGWNNLVTGATVAATSAANGMPVTNIQDATGSSSVAWQTEASVVTATLTVTPTVTSETWRVFGLFRTNLTVGATMTVTLYNNPSTVVWTGSADGLVAGYGQIVLDAGADYTADYATVEITDTYNPDGFLNIPLAFLGPGWRPSVAAAWQSTFSRDHSVSEIVSRGGQEYPVFWWAKRRFDFALNGISGDDLWGEAQEADRVGRMGTNLLFVRNEDADDIQTASVFGRLTVLSDFSYPVKSVTMFAWRARITERI